MSGARVLVVDSQLKVRRLAQRALTAQGYNVTLAAGGEQALELLNMRPPDVILLALGLPDISGLEVCRIVRLWSCVPIIALSDGSDEQEKVRVLDLGADDYLAKPFGVEELGARVRVALRHAAGARLRPVILLGEGDLKIDFQERRVWRGEEEVHLTPREYDLLKYLIQHRDTDLRFGEVQRGVWGLIEGTQTGHLRRYIPRLRNKIERDPKHPRFLLSYRGSRVRLRSTG